MNTAFSVILIMALLTSATLFLIYQNPDEIPKLLSFEKDSREISQINEESKGYQLIGDMQKFNDSKKLMQEKLKEISLYYMGLEISDVDLIDGYYPFQDSQAVIEKFGLNSSLVCDFEQNIAQHMHTISQTENFQMFAKKYSQYKIELYLMDERSYLSNIHYGLSAGTENQSASTYFHLNSCANEVTDKELYFLRCVDDSDSYEFATFNYEDIVSSLSSPHFCKIELDSWRQSLYDYSEILREERWQLATESMPKLVDSESHMKFFSEMNKHEDLGNIVGKMVQGKFDEQRTQDMIKQYEEQYGSLPEELLELIGNRT